VFTCLEHGIDDEAFAYLEKDVIHEIIPKIGMRIKFLRHYKLSYPNVSTSHMLF
jgi:hypothetical protein